MKRWYSDLDPRKFMPAHTGVRVFQHTFDVPTKANKTEYTLEDKSVIENNHVVGIWVRKLSGNAKGFDGAALINDDAFDSAYLTLIEKETNVIKRVPLRHIHQANENGTPYFVQMGSIQMNESQLYFSNKAVLVTGEVVQFTFDFVKLRPSLKKKAA